MIPKMGATELIKKLSMFENYFRTNLFNRHKMHSTLIPPKWVFLVEFVLSVHVIAIWFCSNGSYYICAHKKRQQTTKLPLSSDKCYRTLCIASSLFTFFIVVLATKFNSYKHFSPYRPFFLSTPTRGTCFYVLLAKSNRELCAKRRKKPSGKKRKPLFSIGNSKAYWNLAKGLKLNVWKTKKMMHFLSEEKKDKIILNKKSICLWYVKLSSWATCIYSKKAHQNKWMQNPFQPIISTLYPECSECVLDKWIEMAVYELCTMCARKRA